MLIVCLIFMTFGFAISQFGVLDAILDKFRLDDYNDYEEEFVEQAPYMPAPAPAPINGRHITIFPKQKKGKAGKYYYDAPRKFKCDMITYKDGVLVCHIFDSLLEEEFNIKDIDEFII